MWILETIRDLCLLTQYARKENSISLSKRYRVIKGETEKRRFKTQTASTNTNTSLGTGNFFSSPATENKNNKKTKRSVK